MTFNFMAPKLIYLKSEMTELDPGLDIEVPTGQVGNLHGWVSRVVLHVNIVVVVWRTLSCKHAPLLSHSKESS